jgi:cephalosporin hydroxylase
MRRHPVDEQLSLDRSRIMAEMVADSSLTRAANEFLLSASRYKYTYFFDWLGRPIIQLPQDIVAVQELVWRVRPDLIIETGVAHGGSLVLSASLLALLDMSDAIASGTTLDPRRSRRRVIGIDIDIRAHNRHAIETHPMASRIEMIEGSSISCDVVATVRERSKAFSTIMVFLDSNHTHDHVLAELEAYAPLVSIESYCVVFDTVVDHMPKSMFPDRPWGPDNNPKTAVHEFLRTHAEFQIDADIHNKLLITVAPDGYLKRSF